MIRTESSRQRPAIRRRRSVPARVAVGLLVAGLLATLPGPAFAAARLTASDALASQVAAAGPVDPTPKLRADLAALVAGSASPDPRLRDLVPGLTAGEIPFFAVLSGPLDSSRRTSLDAAGVRVLRAYRTVDAVALVGAPVAVLRVAALGWVDWLAPVEVVVALADPPGTEPLADQTRGGPTDVGAVEQWTAGRTGTGVRIAVLDTGHDPAHPDLDDLDFRRWTQLLPPPGAKVVDARNFNGGGCAPFAGDGHGHGTHVAGIATGTAEGGPTADDNGTYAGVAPDAELAVGKVLTDAGAGVNSDLIAALEWAAMPAESGPTGCAIGADIVNLSLGSEARPTRLNSGQDADLVSLVVNRLAVRYGTLIVAAAGNSGPYIGSVLETPGSAAQALSVGASAKDWDLNHDDTQSGDTCSGYRHPRSPSAADNDCRAGVGTQGASVASFSSRGPSGDLWLRPDLVAPGYAIVSAQSTAGTALAGNDLNIGTRDDPRYATASGTSMAAPTAAGSAALVLEAYRDAHGTDPSGASGVTGLPAPAHALLRAALMNTATSGLEESRWILTTDARTRVICPREVLDLINPTYCAVADIIGEAVANSLGSVTLYEVRNGAADPAVGPLAEGAGKLSIGRAIAALRDGIVIYSAASGTGADAGTGPRDLQGSWQVGSIEAGTSANQRFVVHGAPGAAASVSFTFEPGAPSDGSHSIPAGWTVRLPSATSVPAGGDAIVTFGLDVPAGAPAGLYTGAVVARTGAGQTLRIPVFAAVALHDPELTADNTPGPQAAIESERDVFAKDDTLWPSAAGAALGATADWRVYPVELAAGLGEARFAVHDTAAGDETYDIYVYDAAYDLLASSHPFTADGVSDAAAQRERGPSTAADPTTVVLAAPTGGRFYVAVNRAKIGRGPFDPIGDMGSFRLTLDEVAATGPAAASALAYEGDHVFRQGTAGRLAARLTSAAGMPIAGRPLTFTFDDGTSPCPGDTCRATTGPDGLAQVATDPIALANGIHEIHVRFAGDAAWTPAAADALALVIGAGAPPPVGGTGGGEAHGGGWFVPDGTTAGSGDEGRIHLALQVRSGLPVPTGDLRWTDRASGVDLRLEAWTSLVVDRERALATATGRARTPAGGTVTFELTIRDAGEPGRDHDTIRLRLLDGSYDRAGTLGGGNLQVRAG
ncbi:MAG TPA: S8 family serine peptidase [Candidatus Limnocylindrales bacterium]|nr:S8 family serine peptidase [Candidatus Limnocylindrales bacterium]